MLGEVFNNAVIGRLREGSAQAVNFWISFGLRPEVLVDLVSESANTHVTRRSAWFWTHQAAAPEGARAWWPWVHEHLEQLSSDRQAAELRRFFEQACEASCSTGHAAPLLATWEQALQWDGRCEAWSRDLMMRLFTHAVYQAGNPAAPVVGALSTHGWVKPADWSVGARSGWPYDPVTAAVDRGQADLLEALLNAGAAPETIYGDSLLARAWTAFQDQTRPDRASGVEEVCPSAVVITLLQQGAPVDALTRDGTRASDEAQENRHQWMSRWPELASAWQDRWLRVALEEAPAPTTRARRTRM